MKKKYVGILIILLIGSLIYNLIDFSIHITTAEEVTRGISEKIIRFHVLANSDEEYDQRLKIEIKDAVVKYLTPKLQDVVSKAEARAIIERNYANIRKVAENKVSEEGYSYQVHVYLTKCDFPTKIYDNLTFPAGRYEALRVDIGNANGKNWWCLMYPPLCFVDGTLSVVPEHSNERLKNILTSEEYDTLYHCKDVQVKYRFKLVEILKKLF